MASRIARFAVKSAREVLIPRQGLQAQHVRCMSGPNPEIAKKQEQFQKDDDIPVHLKGGIVDQILYRTTMGLCIVAVGMFAWNIAEMAVGKK